MERIADTLYVDRCALMTISRCILLRMRNVAEKSLGEMCEEREKTNKMQQSDVYYRLSQHVSGIIMPIFRRTKTVLLHLVYCSGSAGCGW